MKPVTAMLSLAVKLLIGTVSDVVVAGIVNVLTVGCVVSAVPYNFIRIITLDAG
jgi:hypothetical protein